MKVTTQQKVLLGFLSVGIVFLSYDQLHATPAPVVEQEDVAVPRTAPVVVPASTMLSVAARLNQLPRTEVRDAFATLATAAPAQSEVSVADFKGKYHLTAVILSGSQAKAMINGSLVRIGQTIDGYTLLSLDRSSAVLQNGTLRVVLQID